MLDFASLYFFVFSASLTASGESITVPTSKLTSTSFENNSFKIALNSQRIFSGISLDSELTNKVIAPLSKSLKDMFPK